MFQRYDLSGNGRISSREELTALTLNLAYKCLPGIRISVSSPVPLAALFAAVYALRLM